jgi:SpoVK/Ycf46/Vps4 family AAA+-type ATPase
MDIRHNYTATVSKRLEEIMKMKQPWNHGRLLIWYGDPGTGKTYAIRALMMEWKHQFDFVVVTDPEQFTRETQYYFQLSSRFRKRRMRSVGSHLLHDRDELSLGISGDEEEEETEVLRGTEKRTLFIMEDSADLILQESRSMHYDKIGKLLNMTDGLFGQGRQDLFLLTFNEDVDRIDPAFVRPGRCIEKVEFELFEPLAAEEWLKGHQKPQRVSDPISLAEMYARLYGKEFVKSQEHELGVFPHQSKGKCNADLKEVNDPPL